ncbi:MAG: methyltransferase domain-containing protein [Verrucomicrobia bacterium]|nr:methyltransferase domain-containing protein [Verrucomicrobiota bacterium]
MGNHKIIKLIAGFFFLAVVCLSIVFIRSDASTFLFHYFKDPSHVGSVLPSSSAVSKEMTRELKKNRPPYRILEVGAGTGVITEAISEFLQPEDLFDVVEIDPEFCQLIESKLPNHPQRKVHCLSVTQWHPDYKYDVIISTLPFNSLTPEVVHEVLDAYSRLIVPHGQLSYIEYMGLPGIKKIFLQGGDLEEFLAREREIAEFQKSCCCDRRTVCIWRNFPPTYVHRFRLISQNNPKKSI